MIAHTLYICYFGGREPLVQTQVVPYLRELTRGGASKESGEPGIKVSLLTFEPEQFGENEETKLRAALAESGIEWLWLRYHKRPSVPATFFDVLNGARFVRKLIGQDGLDILHARSHVPMLIAAIARKLSSRKPKIIFDIRGFFPEEYADAGIWPEGGWLFRIAKRIEKWLLKEADGFVVLTERAREILFGLRNADRGLRISDEAVTDLNPESKIQNPKSDDPPLTAGGTDRNERPVEVIPCCVDMRRFEAATVDSRRKMREKLEVGERFVVVYVGSFGGWYMAEETADFLGALKTHKPDAFAMILSQSNPEMIEPLLCHRGYGDGDYFIERVPVAEIPLYLSAADAAVSFIKPCYSKQASSPTKNAEYLACGLPIVVNDGIGDTTELTTADGTGVVISDFSAVAYEQALDELDKLMAEREELSQRCKASARKRFDLTTVGGVRYRRLYSMLYKQ